MTSSLSEALKTDALTVERFLSERLAAGNESYGRLTDAMRYSAVEAGGKRIRPFLTLEFCRMLRGEINTAAVGFGAALEAVHNYSLIHDDMPCMDNDRYRRGKLTCHAVFGEATALLAGDSLLTAAFGWAAECDAPAETVVKAVKLLSEHAGFRGMAGGQMLDLMSGDGGLDSATFYEMNALKTGALIRLGCQLGCLAAGFDEGSAQFTAADRFGKNIGLAFQIEDDLLDMGTEDGKQTFLSFMSEEQARAEIKRLTEEALGILGPFENSSVLREFAVYLAERDR